MPHEEERLSAYMLFKSLGPKEAGEIDDVLERIDVPAGQELFQEGDAGMGLYIIREGEVEIRKKSPDGTYQVIATLGKFAMLGEMSLITEARRNATAVTTRECKLFRVDKKAFLKLLDEGSLPAYKICLAIARFLAYRLDQLDAKMVKMMQQRQAPEAHASIKEVADYKAKLFPAEEGEKKED